MSDTLFERACRREPTPRRPIWMMRQAGRYLPGYQALRGRRSFWELCTNPVEAAQVTLEPIEVLGVDAAVIFSDIMTPLPAMGAPVSFDSGAPVLASPVRSAADVAALRPVDPARDVPFMLETIERVRAALDPERAVLGFAGAPFTLAAYLVEGGGSKTYPNLRAMMFGQPDLFDELLNVLADSMAVYLEAQIAAGAQAVQLFDSWAGTLTPREFARFAARPAGRVFRQVKGAPCVYFVRGNGPILEDMIATGAEVLSIDWRWDMAATRERAAGRVALQGNLEPGVLLGPPELVEARAREVLEAYGDGPGHIFNLGHGILPITPVEAAVRLVEVVQSWSP